MPAAAKTRTLVARTLVDRSLYLAWNALTVLVFVILTAYVARADAPVLAVVGLRRLGRSERLFYCFGYCHPSRSLILRHESIFRRSGCRFVVENAAISKTWRASDVSVPSGALLRR